MLNSFLETDFIAKGLPNISELDLEDKSLIDQLEYCNIHYLIYLYSTKTHYKKSIRLLQKFVKKNRANLVAVEQIWLTCIKFEDHKLLDMNMNVYKRLFNKHLDRIRLFKDLSYKIIYVEDKEVQYFNNKCTEIYNKILEGLRSFTYQSFIIYKKYTNNFFMDIDNTAVYDYKCNTVEYTDILKKYKDILLYNMDINILFLYTYISRMGCLLIKCTKKCCDKKDKELRDLLLNDLYLLKLGVEDRTFILKFYNRRKDIEEDIKYIEYEEIKPRDIKYKAEIHKDNISRDSEYITSRKLYDRKYNIRDDMYSVIGSAYTLKVRRNLFKDKK